MNVQERNVDAVLILADESADWNVAGLSQLQRLLLGLSEYFPRTTAVPICVWSNSDQQRDAPRWSIDRHMVNLAIIRDIEHFSSEMANREGAILVLNTRLVVDRDGFSEIVDLAYADEQTPALILSPSEVNPTPGFFFSLTSRINQRSGASAERSYIYLDKIDKIDIAEKKLLSSTAKSQDGLVSQFVNRPISRAVSRLLVRLPLLPNQWTLVAMVIPIAGAILLLRGDYFGFAIGAILFQLHSILDGCDGEIARAKYLESRSGETLDRLCDRFTTLLYAVALGLGLSRQTGFADAMRWFYLVEGVTAALFIGVGETLLTRDKIDKDLERETQNSLYPAYVKTHRGSFNEGDQLKLWMIKHSGMLLLGQRATSFFGQATKRDVFNFGFMLLALCGRPSWILHILATCACVIIILALKNLLAAPLKANRTRVS
jgi:hypothetical protein